MISALKTTALVDNPVACYVYLGNGTQTVSDPVPTETWSSWTSMNDAILTCQKVAAEHKASAAVSAAKERYVGGVYGTPADVLTRDSSATNDGSADAESPTSAANGLYPDYIASEGTPYVCRARRCRSRGAACRGAVPVGESVDNIPLTTAGSAV